MKIFAFTDLHEDLRVYKRIKEKLSKEKPDLILCAGDFTVFEQHVKEMMEKLAVLGKMFLVHGNHETEGVVKKLCEKNGLVFLHKRFEIIGDYAFVGYGSEGFDVVCKDFEDFILRIKSKIKDKKVVLLTHAPFYNTKLDHMWNKHRGNKSFSDFIKKNKNVVLGVCGHFHETFHKKDKLNQALIINPGPDGEFVKI